MGGSKCRTSTASKNETDEVDETEEPDLDSRPRSMGADEKLCREASEEYLGCVRRIEGPGGISEPEKELLMPGRDWVLCCASNCVRREYSSTQERDADFLHDRVCDCDVARSAGCDVGAGGRIDRRRWGCGKSLGGVSGGLKKF